MGLPSLKKLKLATFDDDEFKSLVEMLNASPTTKFNKLQSLSLSFGCWRGGGTAIEITKIASLCPNLQKLKLAGPLVLDLLDRSQIFQHLNKLTLEHSNLVEDPMPALGKLPNLRVLCLHSALGKDAIMFPKNSFPCLQSFVLSQEEQPKEWIIEEEALCCLSFLKLYFCINLKTVPERLRFLDSLQELQIVDMPLAFMERIQRGGEDFHKVENVPSLLLETYL